MENHDKYYLEKQLMSKCITQLTSMVMIVFFAVTLIGCGGSDDGSNAELTSPLWCKAPNTISEDGTSCEFVPSACNYPEVANDDGVCVMDMNEWIDGSNGIDMPQPAYTPKAGEVVLYYALSGDESDTVKYKDWGLHAWNDDNCKSYADYADDGGTAWDTPLAPTAIDPNFGAYWVMKLIETPNCVNFIPHKGDEKTPDLQADLYSAAQNPTGAFFVLQGYEQYVFPYPRTFDSLVVPGGGSEPEDPPKFTPGEDTKLYLRGGMNNWEVTEGDLYEFDYYDQVYTLTVFLEGSDDPYEFKIADMEWSNISSFGVAKDDDKEDEQIVELGAEHTKELTSDEGQNLSLKVTVDGNFQFSFDATDPEKPKLTVTSVHFDKTLYVMDTTKNNDDDNNNDNQTTTPMVYQGNNIYFHEQDLVKGDFLFKVADSRLTDETYFGAATENELLGLDEVKTLVNGKEVAQNVKLSIEESGKYRFILDGTDLIKPTIQVLSTVPYGTSVLYLRGNMNNWVDDEDEMVPFKFNYADNHYTLVTTLKSEVEHEFKIADLSWTDGTNFGAAEGEQQVSLDEAKTLDSPGGNLKLTIENDEGSGDENLDLLVAFDLDATDSSKPKLTVSKYIPLEGQVVYLRGSMNGWAKLDAYQLSEESLGVYSVTTTLEAGDYEFKVADENWGDKSTVGAIKDSEQVTLGEPLTATLKGENFKLSISDEQAGSYKFTVNLSTGIPVITVAIQ